MRLALAVASIIVFIVHGVVFYDQFFHHWERHQTAYFDQARAESTNDAEREEFATRRPRSNRSSLHSSVNPKSIAAPHVTSLLTIPGSRSTSSHFELILTQSRLVTTR